MPVQEGELHAKSFKRPLRPDLEAARAEARAERERQYRHALQFISDPSYFAYRYDQKNRRACGFWDERRDKFEKMDLEICYVTSVKDDPMLSSKNLKIQSFYILIDTSFR